VVDLCRRGGHTGRVLGGYALAYTPGSSDILKDGVTLAKFFRKAQAADGALFEPPVLERWWEQTPLRRVMFQELHAAAE
jgi:hypothetical protein